LKASCATVSSSTRCTGLFPDFLNYLFFIFPPVVVLLRESLKGPSYPPVTSVRGLRWTSFPFFLTFIPLSISRACVIVVRGNSFPPPLTIAQFSFALRCELNKERSSFFFFWVSSSGGPLEIEGSQCLFTIFPLVLLPPFILFPFIGRSHRSPPIYIHFLDYRRPRRIFLPIGAFLLSFSPPKPRRTTFGICFGRMTSLRCPPVRCSGPCDPDCDGEVHYLFPVSE